MKKTILWLDDVRDPSNEFHWRWIPEITQGTHEIVWVKDYKEFTNFIRENKMPDIISFDHDIADEHNLDFMEQKDYSNSEELVFPNYDKFYYPTGYDAAKWLIDFCINNKIELPKWRVHSANIVGTENIRSVLLNYMKNNGKDSKLG
jgi:hypothetical protein